MVSSVECGIMGVPIPGQAGGSTTREHALAFARQITDAINAHDVSAIMDFYAEDAILVTPVFNQVAGRAAIAGTFELIFSTYPDWQVSLSDVFVEGDRIAMYGTATATDQKGWFGLPPTGGPITYRAVIVLTLAHRKIIRDERLYDLTALVERLEKARMDQELKTAAEVQNALLSRTVAAGHYYDAAGDSVPCRTIGGDFFEFVELPSGEFGVALGDVAGKGPSAALLAAMLQGMFTSEARMGTCPSLTLARMNSALADRRLGWRFATVVYGVLSPDGRLVYSNAGHNAPIILERHGIRRLTTGGPILGALPDTTFQEETLYLTEGDSVIMFSDGVTEARNARDEEFGEQRLISFLSAHRDHPGAHMAKRILSAVQEFSQGRPQEDDMTVTATRFRKR